MEENLIEIAMKMILNAECPQHQRGTDAVMDDNRTLAEENLWKARGL
ncbi:MAG: hypothetical protein ACLUOD_18915 [[Clostridium] innocuum]